MMGTIPIGDKHSAEDMQRMFELFPRLKERRNQRAMTMSGGEQQMLAIARALMSRPKLLLLDEPSLGLAPIIVKQIFSTLRELAATGMTIFLVEQNANHALKLSDRAYVMVNGEIRLSGTGQNCWLMKRSGTLIWAATESVNVSPFPACAPDVQLSRASLFAIVENNFDGPPDCDIKPLQMVVLSPFRLVQVYCGTGC